MQLLDRQLGGVSIPTGTGTVTVMSLNPGWGTRWGWLQNSYVMFF